MKTIIRFSLFALIGLFIFSACADSSTGIARQDTITSIPSSVSMVTAVDVPSIMKKMDFEAVQKMSFYQKAIEEATHENPLFGKVLEDPTASGIDLSKNIYTAYDMDAKKLGNYFNYAIANVADVSKLENMIAEADFGDVATKEGYKVVKPNRKQIIAWSDQMVVAGMALGYMDTEAAIERIFTTDEENSIASNKDLRKCLKKQHDVSSWMSSNGIAENPDAKMGSGFAGIKADDLKDNFIHGHLDFNDGAINSVSSFFLKKGLTKDFDLFFKDEVNTNFSKYVPTENIGFGFTAALDIKGIKQVLKEQGMAGQYVDFALQDYGLSMDDIAATFDGDLFFGAYPGASKDDGHGIFATKLSSDEVIFEVLKAGVELGAIEKIADSRYRLKGRSSAEMNPFGKNGEGYLMVNDGFLYASSSEAVLDQIAAGGFAKNDFSKKITNLSQDNIFALLTDFAALKKVVEDADFSLLNDLEFTTARKGGTFNLSFKDENENSLKQLMEAIERNYEKNSKEGTEL